MEEEKNIYDLTVLLNEDNEDIVKELIKKYGGEYIADIKPFSKINLSFEIKGYAFAFMAAVKLSITPSFLLSLREEMDKDERVLRYLFLKIKDEDKKKAGKKIKRLEKQDKKPAKKDDFVSNEDLEEKIKEFE
jgi:ribosomal protein S6